MLNTVAEILRPLALNEGTQLPRDWAERPESNLDHIFEAVQECLAKNREGNFVEADQGKITETGKKTQFHIGHL